MHPRIENPIVLKIKADVGHIYANLDNSKSTMNKIDFLTISWIAKFLSIFDDDVKIDFINRCKPIVDNFLLSDSIDFRKLKIKEIEGLFIFAEEIIEQNQQNSGPLKDGFERLLSQLDEKNWLSSPTLAAYAIFGLDKLVSEEYIESCRKYIESFIGSEVTDQILRHPEILLGLPTYVNHQEVTTRLKMESDIPDSSITRAILLFVLTKNVHTDDRLKEPIYNMLESCAEEIGIADSNHNPMFQSLLGLGFINLNLFKVHLVNDIDYNKVRVFFETETVVVSKRIEYIQESIVLSCIIIVIGLLSVLVSPYLLLALQIYGPLYIDIASWVLIGVTTAIFTIFLAPLLLPELSNLVRRTKPSPKGEYKDES
ncbi:MAG: hypothetical protein ACTSSE_13980 [Candidatus Thorarchaeota archaeon]